ncbi:hypothetical protein DRQ53_02335 [bacterium]|nr:MAG: hypothetical protein DRQ32_00705 [bacterium]RKZ17821.1 MAG: hypothetical protein DRQ53_02335 [bacterium]
MATATVTVDRFVLPAQHAMLATGNFAALIRGWQEHAQRWELSVDGLGEVLMHQGLAGAALQLSFRVPEETTAFTLNLHQPPANLFVAGGGAAQTLTGRYYSEGVQESGFSRLFVQRAHPQKELQRSVLRVSGLDLFGIFEQFFASSEQGAARFIEHDATRFSMVLGLPEADPDWLAGLEAADVDDLKQAAERLDERVFKLHCGCSPEKVAGTLTRMFASQADEFFAGEPVVEALCPRCGARHLLDRKTFDRLVDKL